MAKKELEVYLHVPFCMKKCAYCDFLSAPGSRSQQIEYIRALKKEIASFPNKNEYGVTSVFWGGGTPSVLSEREIADVMEELYAEFSFSKDCEISIECNPGTVDEEKLVSYYKSGINRLSIGLQSANDEELKLLGRIHSWQDFLHTYELAEKAGFGNINIDLMSALPMQTEATWEHTLQQVLALHPKHISAYSLIIEEGTPFFDRYYEDLMIRDRGGIPKILPSEETERTMYRMTKRMLQETGMYRYEISNYAFPGYECRHNIGYWRGTEYVGFGLGASSLLSGVRYRNPEEMSEYLAGDFSGREIQKLERKDQMEEFAFLGLRMMDGISESEFLKRFGQTIDSVYNTVLEQQINSGLLVRENGRIRLTEKGIDLSNMVMAEFLLEEIE